MCLEQILSVSPFLHIEIFQLENTKEFEQEYIILFSKFNKKMHKDRKFYFFSFFDPLCRPLNYNLITFLDSFCLTYKHISNKSVYF